MAWQRKKRENAMEKQEILEKSRRENQKGDERERTIRMEEIGRASCRERV